MGGALADAGKIIASFFSDTRGTFPESGFKFKFLSKAEEKHPQQQYFAKEIPQVKTFFGIIFLQMLHNMHSNHKLAGLILPVYLPVD